MKEIIDNAKHSKKSNFPRKLKIDNKIKAGEDKLANAFDNFFTDVGPYLTKIYLIHRYRLKNFEKN